MNKKGLTLIESIVAITLMIIVISFAAPTLSAATKVFYRIQDNQYATSILDTILTQLRTETKEANKYIKIYKKESDMETIAPSAKEGSILEFENKEGYIVVLSDEGISETQIYIAGQNTNNNIPAIDKGQLIKRYYFLDESKSTYQNSIGGQPIARAVTSLFTKKFYMNNYVQVTYSLPHLPEGKQTTNNIIITVSLYEDSSCQKLIVSDSEILEFDEEVKISDTITVKNS